jgi:FtsP/CotA-like multicopper oxidase with cupredoxin domain
MQIVLGAALTAPWVLRPRGALAGSQFRPLSLPPLDEGSMDGGRRVFDLGVARGQTEFFDGHMTDTIGINAPYLGPILRARAGDALRMNVTNTLDEATALHWHGLHLPAAADGGPHQPIAPGTVWSPEFDVMQKAGTFWFHSHMHGRTGPQVWAGLAGMIRIEDDEEAALPLPRSHGEDDFTLVLQDRYFDDTFQMPYALNMHSRMSGLQGDRAMVNGQLDPVLETDVPRVRLRILNGSNGSIYRLHFSDRRGFYQIGSDGGLLSAPVALTEAPMAPGERADYILDLSDGTPAMLRAELFGSEAAFAGSNGTLDFLEIRPRRAQSPAPALPDRLADVPPPAVADGETRDFALAMTGMGMMGDFTINGARFDHDRIDFTVPRGATETWVWTNTTEMLHPMHIHDVQFRVLSRNGAPPAPREAGLKDTVLIAPRETVALRLTFTDFADPVLPYMYHCHILEHEDAGMMGQFTVV